MNVAVVMEDVTIIVPTLMEVTIVYARMDIYQLISRFVKVRDTHINNSTKNDDRHFAHTINLVTL